jgi:hypothetical protein
VKLTETHWQLLELAEEGALVRDEDPDAVADLIAAGLLREVTDAAEDDTFFIEMKVCRLTPAGRVELAKKPS